MKDLKKVLALVLITVMAACMLAACGGSKQEAAPADDGADAAPAEEAAHYVIATDKGFSPFEFEDEKGNIVDEKYKVILIDKGKLGHGVTSKTTGKLTYLQGNIFSKIK